MNIAKEKNRFSKGFTLVEILVIVAIIALIAGITIAAVRSSKNKAIDADTRKIISELALKVEAEEIAPGVVDYSKAFTATDASAVVNGLGEKLGLTDEDYQISYTPTEYAIVFPLKKGGYYCVDSLGHATGKEVVGLFADTGPQNCDTATRVVIRPDGWGDDGDGGNGGGGGGGGGNQAPVIVFPGVDGFESMGLPGPGLCSPDGCVVYYNRSDFSLSDDYTLAQFLGVDEHNSPLLTQYRIQTVFQFPWSAISVADTEEGDITSNLDYDDQAVYQSYVVGSDAAGDAIASYVNTTFHGGTPIYDVSECEASYYQMDFRASDSEGLVTNKPFKIYSCIISIIPQ